MVDVVGLLRRFRHGLWVWAALDHDPMRQVGKLDEEAFVERARGKSRSNNNSNNNNSSSRNGSINSMGSRTR